MRQPSSGRVEGSAQGDFDFIWLVRIGFLGLFALVSMAPMFSGDELTGAGNPLRQAGYVAVALLVLVGARPWIQPRALLSLSIPVAISLLLCMISLTWSIAPSIGVRRLFLTVIVAWTIFTAVKELGYRQTLALVRIAFVVLLVANYVAVLAFPAYGIHQTGPLYEANLVGNWRGTMNHKNFAGATCAVTVLLFTFDSREIRRELRIGVIALSLIFLYFTQSKTSVGMLIGALIVGAIFARVRFRYRLAVVSAVSVAFIALTVYFNVLQNQFLQVVADPFAFTGRMRIWITLANYISDHPLTGSGYGSFWNIGTGSPIYLYTTDWMRRIAAGHNGYLDLTAQVGIPIAMIVIVLIFFVPFFRLLVSTRSANESGGLLMALLVFCAGHNMTETSILERDTPMEAVLMLTLALIVQLAATPLGKRGLFAEGKPLFA